MPCTFRNCIALAALPIASPMISGTNQRGNLNMEAVGSVRTGRYVEHCHSTRTPAQATQSSNGKRTYRSNVHLRTTLHIHLDVRLRRGAGTTITSTCCSLVPRLPQGRSSCRCIVCDSHYVISHSKHAQRILDLFAHFTGTVSRRQRQWRSSLQKRRTLSADSWTNARVS